MMRAHHSADSQQQWSSGLWSLLDMINVSMSGVAKICSQLMLEQLVREKFGDDPVSPQELVSVEGWLKIALSVAKDFDMKAVPDRVALIRRQIGFGITQNRLATEFRVLRETLEFELKGHLIYRYPSVEGEVLFRWQEDWQATRNSFPSAEKDIVAAVDLWALQHSTAAVFHLMRVLEHGLRALASDLGKSFDVQNWQNILDEIESEIRNQAKTLPRGAPKSERLQFLSSAAKEFHFFKDGWRNYVAHNRAVYDQHTARSAMDHVRSFMNGLALHLSE